MLDLSFIVQILKLQFCSRIIISATPRYSIDMVVIEDIKKLDLAILNRVDAATGI